MPTVLVVGASRGIGLALVEELHKRSDTLAIGTVRQPTPALDKLNVKTVTLDITDDASVEAAAREITEIDTLIINAGVPAKKLLVSSPAELSDVLGVNVVGPHRVIRAFLPALRARKTRRIVIISSQSGSIEIQARPNSMGLAGVYGVSKAACNMLTVQYHNELKAEEFTVVSIHPGWVATDMGNLVGDGGMPPAECAKQLLNVVDNLKLEDSAKFFRYDGEKMPW